MSKMKDYLFESFYAQEIIKKYIVKYSKINVSQLDYPYDNSKIIFKNILLNQQEDNEYINEYINHNMSPEDFIIEHYKSKGYNSFFAENNYWVVLFLMFYFYEDFVELYFPHEPAFLTAIHNEDRINKMENINVNILDDIPNLINYVIEAYFYNLSHETNDLTDWDENNDGLNKFFSIDELLVSILYLDNEQLKLIFKRMADGFKYYTSGFPDLIVYNGHEFFFVEVKSKKDTPSFKQIQWHKFLTEVVGIDVVLFMIDKSEDNLIKIKESYNIDLEDSEKRKNEFIKSNKEIKINWDDDKLKQYMVNVNNNDFDKLIEISHSYPRRHEKYVVNEYTLITYEDFSAEEWDYYIELKFAKINELIYEKAKELYSFDSFSDFSFTNRQSERNKKAKSLEKNGKYSQAVNLYMNNVIERTTDPNTYKRLIYIFNKYDKFNDVIKLMDIAIPIFVTLNDKNNALRFIYQRFAALNGNKSAPAISTLSMNDLKPKQEKIKSKSKSKQMDLSSYLN